MSPDIYSWLLDATVFVYANEIPMVQPCGSSTSTRVTQSPLAPLAMTLLTVLHLPLSVNHNVEPTQYKPFSSISILF